MILPSIIAIYSGDTMKTILSMTAILLALGMTAPAFAGQPRSQATDFSSINKKPAHAAKPSGPPRNTMRPVTTTTRATTRSGSGQNFKSSTIKASTIKSSTIKSNNITTTTKKININAGNQSSPAFKSNAIKFQNGPGQVSKAVFKPAPNVKFVKLGQFSAPVWKSGPKKIWWGNKWKVFVPITALGVVVLGGAYYYPDAYLTTSRYYCEGISPDGCRLNWQRVDFEDGDADWQCVQYCPRPGAPPPPRTVALVAPPPPQRGACEISIYSEPNFGGTNAQASDAQPHLSDNGWQNQIASVKVKSGTWDFFTDQEFTGETMRLPPGEYPTLAPDWTKKAGSFMCAQP
jgi:hypothetical protein